MGVESLIGGLFGLGSAAITASSAKSVSAANAAAQADINEKTMKFNREEALKARNFSSAEAKKERTFNAQQAEIARKFSAEQTLAAQQYQERLSSTAHQREVADLAAAGLNPILSATGGNGSAVPVAPILGSSAASQSGSPSGAQASVSGLHAPRKENYLGAFAHTAMEGMRLDNDLKRAKAEEVRAEAAKSEAETSAKRQVQDSLESMERITNIKADTDLKKVDKLGKENYAKLIEEQISSEIVKRQDGHALSEAQRYAVVKTADAAATAHYAQAQLANIRGELETEKNPSVIKELNNKADYWKSEFDKNEWVISDPESIARREWWKEDRGAYLGAEALGSVIGNVLRVGVVKR